MEVGLSILKLVSFSVEVRLFSGTSSKDNAGFIQSDTIRLFRLCTMKSKDNGGSYEAILSVYVLMTEYFVHCQFLVFHCVTGFSW